MVARIGVAFALVLFSLPGCGGADPEPTEHTSATQEMLAAGCHEVCPKCPPKQICPLSPCYLECKPTKCTQTQLCVIGDVWSDTACACVPQ